jgi:hypothetical protein
MNNLREKTCLEKTCLKNLREKPEGIPRGRKYKYKKPENIFLNELGPRT